MLYLISNRKLALNKDFYNIIDEAVRGGINAIILREKDLSSEELLKMAVRIKEIIGEKEVKLIINSNFKVAETVEAHGFHTSFNSFINEKPCFNGILGVSVHSVKEAIEAEKHEAHYILFGHIFKTNCKKDLPPKGLELLMAIKREVNIPVIALGGINPENIKEVKKTGADGVAVMSAIMEAEHPYALTKEYIYRMMY